MKKALNKILLVLKYVAVLSAAYFTWIFLLRFRKEYPPKITIETAPGGGEKPMKKQRPRVSNDEIAEEERKLKCGE